MDGDYIKFTVMDWDDTPKHIVLEEIVYIGAEMGATTVAPFLTILYLTVPVQRLFVKAAF